MTSPIPGAPDPHEDPRQPPTTILPGAVAPDALASQLRADSVIMFVGRAANSSDTEARRPTAQAIYAAVEELAANGIDVRHLLPPEEVLRGLVAQQRGHAHRI